MCHQVIESKSDLRHFMEADRISCGIHEYLFSKCLMDPVSRFQWLLRVVEYYRNCRKDPPGRVIGAALWWQFHRLRIRLSFCIPLNVFGPGLSIAHYGSIIVNKGARIGANCRIHPGVCIGGLRGKYPIIGNNVYLGPGAKIFGGVVIGDDSAIGANAVVSHSVPAHVTVAGSPARIISVAGSQGLIVRGSELVGCGLVDWNTLRGAEVLDTPATSLR